VLFGGDSYSSVSMNDTWTWDGTDWTQQHPAHRPGARDDLGMADDAAAGTVVLFGGRGSCRPCGDFGIRGDTRTWDGTDWTLVRKAHIPPPREGHSIAYDSARGTVVMFGGRDIYHFYSDTWTWDGSRWTNHPAASISLRPRSGSPGTSIHIKGHGFTAFKSVEITFVDSTLGVVFLKEFFADTNGTFSGRVRIPSNASPGRQYIQARGRPRRVQKAKRGFTVT